MKLILEARGGQLMQNWGHLELLYIRYQMIMNLSS